MPPPRRDSLQPMNVEGAGSSVNVGATPFADSEDGCRRLPWFCKWCSNRVALAAIVGLVFTVALLASFLGPFLDAAKAGTSSFSDSAARQAVLENAVTFLAIGDWGQRGSREQAVVANAMGAWATAVNASFVVSVGDNFYWNGVENTSDPQFDESWRLVYAAPGLRRPWLAIFGNHDYLGNLSAQESYNADPRWSAFKNRSVVWPLPGGGNSSTATESCVAAVFLDTTPLIPAYRADGGAMAANLNASAAPEEQLAWLDGALAAASARCPAVLAFGHHPGVSCGAQGNQPGVRDRVFPLLARHGADAYVSGHDHVLGLLSNGTVLQVISGGGSDVQPGSKRTPETLWFEPVLGFTVHSINQTHAAHTFVHGETGAVLHSITRELLSKQLQQQPGK